MPARRSGPPPSRRAKRSPKSGERRRDREGTRADILEAARVAFTNAGFDAVGVREIAAAAEANAALVNRYFGGKQQLFNEAVVRAFDIRALLEAGDASLAARLAAEVTRKKDATAFDATMATVRSAGSHTAAPLLRAGLERDFITPLAATVPSAHASSRAALVAALLMGFAIARDVLGVGALRKGDRQWTEDMLRTLLEVLLTSPATDHGRP